MIDLDAMSCSNFEVDDDIYGGPKMANLHPVGEIFETADTGDTIAVLSLGTLEEFCNDNNESAAQTISTIMMEDENIIDLLNNLPENSPLIQTTAAGLLILLCLSMIHSFIFSFHFSVPTEESHVFSFPASETGTFN